MFTGIVTAMGKVMAYRAVGNGGRMRIQTDDLLERTAIGDSIAVDGACLTAVQIEDDCFEVDVSVETTVICKHWRVGDRVNLELPLPAGARLGGHFVSGHVEDSVRLLRTETKGEGKRLFVAMPNFAMPYIINKGSVTLDGVSLTITGVYHGFSGIREAAAQTAKKAETVQAHEAHVRNISAKIKNKDRALDLSEAAHEAAKIASMAMETTNMASDLAVMAAQTASLAMNAAADMVVTDVPSDEKFAAPYFSVHLVPHTLSATTLGQAATNDFLHLETDILARYAHHRDNDKLRSFVELGADMPQAQAPKSQQMLSPPSKPKPQPKPQSKPQPKQPAT